MMQSPAQKMRSKSELAASPAGEEPPFGRRRKHLLDPLDRALLRCLGRDARLSGRRLAELLGVAESTVSTRLRSLLAARVIKGFYADLDLAALGAPLQAMIAVRLGSHSRKDLDSFRRAVSSMPGVLSVFHIGGADDYVLHVVARDADDLRDLVVQHLAMHPAIAHTETSLVFEHWQGTGWQELLDAKD